MQNELRVASAVVPQRFRADVPFTCSAEIVAMGVRHRGPSKAIAMLAMEALVPSGYMLNLQSLSFATLSVGQQQRVVIARALAQVGTSGVLLA